ncbi:LysE family translocator [Niallia sp. 01092]|uniref:LysE family translocator n=1 Tax=unclassified Niallia TaxID=2837522 RepID=UPI003FD33015
MAIVYLLKGIILGVSIAAPVGPIGALCIQRTLTQGRLYGFISGLGAATADGMYGLIAAFGLTIITHFLVGYQFWFQLVGGCFLLYLGAKTARTKAASLHSTVERKTILNAYFSVFLLTLTNPMTILSFIAIFSGFGATSSQGTISLAILLVVGVFIGSACWWILLSFAVNLSREKMMPHLGLVNKLSGSLIILFGLLGIVKVF